MKEFELMDEKYAISDGYTDIAYYGKDYQLVGNETQYFLAYFEKRELIPCLAIKTEDGKIMVKTKMQRRTPEEVVDTLSDFVNSFSINEKGFAEAVTSKHRTLQQSIFRLFLACIREWAKLYDSERYDDRNKRTCELSKKVIEAIKDEDYVPFI